MPEVLQMISVLEAPLEVASAWESEEALIKRLVLIPWWKYVLDMRSEDR